MNNKKPESIFDGFSNRKSKFEQNNFSSNSFRQNPGKLSQRSTYHHPQEQNSEFIVKLRRKDKEIEELKERIIKINKKNAMEIHILNQQLYQFKKLIETLDENRGTSYIINTIKVQSKLLFRSSKDELKTKKIIQNEKCFDNELCRIPKWENSNIPKIIYECVSVLENNLTFMKTIGLYRGSANFALVQKLRFKINNNDYKCIKEQKDPHTITNLIKLCLREIKEPLISLNQLYNEEIQIISIETDDSSYIIYKLKNLIETLPTENQETIAFLMKHLNRVSLVEDNQMSAESLSIVFGACIFYEMISSLEYSKNLEETKIPNKCVKYLIEYSPQIFEDHRLIRDTAV